MRDQYWNLYHVRIPDDAFHIAEKTKWRYGITASHDGRYALFWGVFIECTPEFFDTVEQAKVAAEMIEANEHILEWPW